jgi:dynein heavy chain
MVSFILSDQLRSLIRASLTDFVALFDGNVGTTARLLPNAVPVTFATKAVLDDTVVRLEPSMNEIQATIESFVDTLVVAVDQIPKIETQLFSNSTNNVGAAKTGTLNLKPEHCITVAFEKTFPAFVKKCKESLTVDLTRQVASPQKYLSEFDRHKTLIEKTVYAQVDTFIGTEPSQESMMEEVKRWRTMANTAIISAYPFNVAFPLVDIQCEDLIRDLGDRALSQANRILEKFAIHNREASQK